MTLHICRGEGGSTTYGLGAHIALCNERGPQS